MKKIYYVVRIYNIIIMDTSIFSQEPVVYNYKTSDYAKCYKNSVINLQSGLKLSNNQVVAASSGTNLKPKFHYEVTTGAMILSNPKMRVNSRIAVNLRRTAPAGGAVITTNPFASRNSYCKRVGGLACLSKSVLKLNGQAMATDDKLVNIVNQQIVDSSRDSTLYYDDAFERVQSFDELYSGTPANVYNGILPFGVPSLSNGYSLPRTNHLNYNEDESTTTFTALTVGNTQDGVAVFDYIADLHITNGLMNYENPYPIQGVKRIDYDVDLENDIYKMINISAPLPESFEITSITFAHMEAPTLILQEVTLHDEEYNALKDKHGNVTQTYPVDRYTFHEINSNNFIPSGDTFRVIKDISGIPGFARLIAIAPQVDYSLSATASLEDSMYTPSCYASPVLLKVSQNGNTLVQLTDTRDIFQYSRRNGCKLSFGEWANAGGIIYIDTSKDCSLLSSTNLINNSGANTLQIDVTFRNLSGVAQRYNTIVGALTTSYLTLSSTGATSMNDAITLDGSQVKTVMSHLSVEKAEDRQHTGAGFFDIVKKVGNGLGKAIEFVGDKVKYVKPIFDIAKMVKGGQNYQTVGGCPRGGQNNAVTENSLLYQTAYPSLHPNIQKGSGYQPNFIGGGSASEALTPGNVQGSSESKSESRII